MVKKGKRVCKTVMMHEVDMKLVLKNGSVFNPSPVAAEISGSLISHVDWSTRQQSVANT